LEDAAKDFPTARADASQARDDQHARRLNWGVSP